MKNGRRSSGRRGRKHRTAEDYFFLFFWYSFLGQCLVYFASFLDIMLIPRTYSSSSFHSLPITWIFSSPLPHSSTSPSPSLARHGHNVRQQASEQGMGPSRN